MRVLAFLVVLVVVLLLLLVTGVKQSQLLGLRLNLEFDKKQIVKPSFILKQTVTEVITIENILN